MASDYTVGDLVTEFLTQCGVTTAFGIASVRNIPIPDVIGRRNAIRFVMARGSRAKFVAEHLQRQRAAIAGGEHRSQEVRNRQLPLPGRIPGVTAPGERVHRQARCVGKLHEEDPLGWQFRNAGLVILTASV